MISFTDEDDRPLIETVRRSNDTPRAERQDTGSISGEHSRIYLFIDDSLQLHSIDKLDVTAVIRE